MSNREAFRDEMVEPGHFVGLKFDSGWWFIQAIGTEYVEVKPWVLENEDENRDVVGAGEAGVNTQNIVDTNNNKILEPNDEDRNIVHQVFYGVEPSRMQVFSLFGRDRNKALENYDEPGEPGVFFDGFDSPYNHPDPKTEVFYVNSMAPLRFQPYNPMDEPAEARLSFHVNKIRYTTVTDMGLMKAMLQGQQPAKLEMMGLGVQDSDQVGVPSWTRDAFSEHIHTTREILDSDENSNGDDTAFGRQVGGSAELERSGN